MKMNSMSILIENICNCQPIAHQILIKLKADYPAGVAMFVMKLNLNFRDITMKIISHISLVGILPQLFVIMMNMNVVTTIQFFKKMRSSATDVVINLTEKTSY